MGRKTCLLAGILAGMLTLSSCALLPEEEAIRTAPVIRDYQKEAYEVAVVTRGDLVRTDRVAARYVPVRKESMSFPITGEAVDQIFVKVGDEVQAGQLLGQQRVEEIEKNIENLEISVQELELRLAGQDASREIDLQRVRIQHAESGRTALNEALADVEAQYAASRQSILDQLTVARMRLDVLRENLAKRQLRAPFSGTVTYVRDYEEGHYAAYAEVAVTLADSTMNLFRAETKQWAYFQPGSTYEVEIKGESCILTVADEAALGLAPQDRQEGKKSFVYFTQSGSAAVLEEGDSCVIDLELERRQDVLSVPEEAVLQAGEMYLVYYETDEGVKDYKEVQVGSVIGGRIEITGGLAEGEEIIVG